MSKKPIKRPGLPQLDQKQIKRALLAAFALLLASAFIYALLPNPILVDVAVVNEGTLEVTVDEEGETRIREIYTVSAPIAGKVRRSPREVGDVVVKGETIVAVIQPGDPSFLDVRKRRELEAAVAADEAAVSHAKTHIIRAEAELKFARSELKRAQSLANRGTVSQRTLEKADMEVGVRVAALDEAKSDLELRHRELDSARARLIGPETQSGPVDDGDDCCVQVKAPEGGRVLKILSESEQVVGAGSPLLEIGDPQDLEIVVDLLSTDAVKVTNGAPAHIEGWGGDKDLKARVRRIDPAGFTKVSALGIEEQRVNTVLDLIDVKSNWQQLGHDFRVFVRITVWKSDTAVRVPLSALFRSGDAWAVFKVVDGEARLAKVQIGQRNTEHAEVLSGLETGDRVILHPSDRVVDGIAIEERDIAGL
jgi:HlyD family secretion protein